MTKFDYDALVIGGGPAGSCAAAGLRQDGLRTLVVEKCAFPRFHIGESLLPAGNQVLRETGAWPKVEAVSVHVPAGTAARVNRPSPSVDAKRTRGTRGADARICARRSGCPVSARMTRPWMTAVPTSGSRLS